MKLARQRLTCLAAVLARKTAIWDVSKRSTVLTSLEVVLEKESEFGGI